MPLRSRYSVRVLRLDPQMLSKPTSDIRERQKNEAIAAWRSPVLTRSASGVEEPGPFCMFPLHMQSAFMGIDTRPSYNPLICFRNIIVQSKPINVLQLFCICRQPLTVKVVLYMPNCVVQSVVNRNQQLCGCPGFYFLFLLSFYCRAVNALTFNFGCDLHERNFCVVISWYVDSWCVHPVVSAHSPVSLNLALYIVIQCTDV